MLQEDWEKVDSIIEALEPAGEASKKLQREQLLPGDFYEAWLTCKFTSQSHGTPLSFAIAENMHQREENLLESPCICAALYLDPRFRLCVISSGKKGAAVRNLEALHSRLMTLLGETPDEDSASSTAGPPENNVSVA